MNTNSTTGLRPRFTSHHEEEGNHNTNINNNSHDEDHNNNNNNNTSTSNLLLSTTSLLEKQDSPHATAAMVAAIRAEADTPSHSTTTFPPNGTHHPDPGRNKNALPLLQPTDSIILVGDHHHHDPHELKKPFTALLAQLVPPGGIRSSIFNLAGASIGAGILGLPAASNDAGMLLSFLLLFVITVFSVYSMYLLAVAAENTHIHSFEQMGKIVPILDVFRRRRGHPDNHNHNNNNNDDDDRRAGRPRFDFSHVVACVRFFHSYSGCVAYVISVNDCLSAILRSPSAAAGGGGSPDTSHSHLYALVGTIAIWLFCMLPLVLPKHIDSLRYASTVAVCFMVYFVLVVVVHSCAHGLPVNIHHVKLVGAHTRDVDASESSHNDTDRINWVYLFRSGNPVIQSVGVFTFAYCCQINAFEVFWDLDHKIKKKRNHKNYTWAAFYAMLLCFILYCGVIFFCYLDFGSLALENASILLLYAPLQEGRFYYILIAYIGVLVKLCVAYALLTSAARNSLYYLLGYQELYQPTTTTGTVEGGENKNGHESLDQNTNNNNSNHHHGGKEVTYIDHIPTPKHRKVVLILSVCTLISGLCIPHINVVFGFAGSLSGSCIAFIFPALFYYYSFDYYNYYKPNRSLQKQQQQQQKQSLRLWQRGREEAEEGVRKFVLTGSVEDLPLPPPQEHQHATHAREGGTEADVDDDDRNRIHDLTRNENAVDPVSSSSSCDTTTDEGEESEEAILSGPPVAAATAANTTLSKEEQVVADGAENTTAPAAASALLYGNLIHKRIPFIHLVGLLLLLVSGWVAMVWGTAGTIYNTVLGI